MSFSIKDPSDSTWRTAETLHVKVAGTWHPVVTGWYKDPLDHTWKKIYPTPSPSGFFGFGIYSAHVIEALKFSTETKYNTSASYLTTQQTAGCGSNSSTAGYTVGGVGTTDAIQRQVCKFLFSTETLVFNLIYISSPAKKINTGSTPSYDKMYLFGGLDIATSSTAFSSIDTILFSTEATSVLVSTLSQPCWSSLGASSLTIAYSLWGIEAAPTVGGTYTVCDKVSFSNDTSTSFSTSPETFYSGVVNSQTDAYYTGDRSTFPTVTSKIGKLSFSTESIQIIGATLSVARAFTGGVNSGIKGYFAGGAIAGNVKTNDIDGINFATDTSINPSATLQDINRDLTTYQSGGYL